MSYRVTVRPFRHNELMIILLPHFLLPYFFLFNIQLLTSLLFICKRQTG